MTKTQRMVMVKLLKTKQTTMKSQRPVMNQKRQTRIRQVEVMSGQIQWIRRNYSLSVSLENIKLFFSPPNVQVLVAYTNVIN